MRLLLLFVISTLSVFDVPNGNLQCSRAQMQGQMGPSRIVEIRGKAFIINLPKADGEKVAATSETIIFQRVGCGSCFVASRVDASGNYSVLVGDGEYNLLVNSPSDPSVDYLAHGQRRVINTNDSTSQLINLDISISVPVIVR